MNDAIRALMERQSVRAYTAKQVSDEDLKTIINCGLHAATARGVQPWHITAVRSRSILDRIAAANQAVMAASDDPHMREMAQEEPFDNFRGAPMALIISGEKGEPYAEVDCANATENMAVAAWSLGIASCYIASFRAGMQGPEGTALKKLLGVPRGYEPLFALALGYAAEGEPKPRAERRADTVNIVE